MITVFQDVIKLLKYILFNQGSTLIEICSGLGFTKQYVIDMIKKISDDPINRITLYSKNPRHYDMMDYSKPKTLRNIKWCLDINSLRDIPVTTLLEKGERRILDALLECSGLDIKKSEEKILADNLEPEEKSLVFHYNAPEKLPRSGRNLNALTSAIQQKYYVSIVFKGSTTSMIVKPHGFIRDDIGGDWYLLGQDTDNNSKLILLKRIASVRLLQKNFTRQVPVSRPWAVQIMQKTPVCVEASIENYETVLDKFRKEFGMYGSFQETDDKKILYKGTVPDYSDFKTIVMRLGAAVQILKPESLRDEIIRDAELLVHKIDNIGKGKVAGID